MFGQQSQYNKDLAFGPDYGDSRYQMPLRPGFRDYEDSLTGQDTTVGRDRRLEFTPTMHERQGGQIKTVDAPLSQADLDPEEPNTLTGERLPNPGNSWSNSNQPGQSLVIVIIFTCLFLLPVSMASNKCHPQNKNWSEMKIPI